MSHLVLVGAGHVHLGLFARIPALIRLGHEVTVISKSAIYCYSGMAPGVLGGGYEPDDIVLNIKDLVERPGVKFVLQTVLNVDAEQRLLGLDNGETIPYDVVSFNIGSFIPTDGIAVDSGQCRPAKPILNFVRIREQMEQRFADGSKTNVVVAGGGPAGLEICANLRDLATRRQGELEITLVSGTALMSQLPSGARRSVNRALKTANVRVIENCRLTSFQGGYASFDGVAGISSIEANLVILAVGIQPESLFGDSGLPVGSDGGLLVNRQLQCDRYPEIFGGGDCVSFEPRALPRIGVVACRQNPVISKNVLAVLRGKKLKSFRPRRVYLQIFNLGAGEGLLVWGKFWFKGRLAGWLKDYIDRRFMRRLKNSKTQRQ